MSEWKNGVLADIAFVIMGQSPKGETCSNNSNGTPLLNGPTEFGIKNPVAVQFTTDPKKTCRINDILFCVRGSTTGRMNWANQEYALGRGIAAIRHKEGCNFQYFIRAVLDFNLQLLLGSATGSTFPNVSREQLEKLEILLPPLPEQRAIASVLSSLDDKIDLLHRQNVTLEKMAETLFRQWFVEEAKEQWETGTILDFASHHKISIQPQKNPSIEYFHYSIPAFDNNKNPVQEFGESIQSNKYVVPPNCILFSKLNPHKDKRVWLLLEEVNNNSICSTEFQIVLPKKKRFLYFLYGWLSSKENYNEIASGVGGTSGSHQRIDPSSIFDFQCPYVDDDIIERYNYFAKPIFRKIKTNQSQIRTLTQLRDTLLPKLMSGEVVVN